MKVIKLQPEQRLSTTDFPNPYERFFATQSSANDPHVYCPIIYKCESCGKEIEFKINNFEKHSKLDFSNLQIKDRRFIEEYLQNETLVGFSFLDFYCPTCKKPISIFYKDGYGGKAAEYGVSIKFIIEIE